MNVSKNITFPLPSPKIKSIKPRRGDLIKARIRNDLINEYDNLSNIKNLKNYPLIIKRIEELKKLIQSPTVDLHDIYKKNIFKGDIKISDLKQ
jgi:hypothetical protein